jgi:hypothetical protein
VTREDIEAARAAVRAAFPGLYDEAVALLFRHDPIHIGYVPDEYDPEVRTILPRLAEARDPDNLARIIHEEFVRWFDPTTAGPQARYAAVAAELWAAWQRFQAR